MVDPCFYASEEALRRMQGLAAERGKKFDDGRAAIIDGECQEVNVSATGDVELLEHKP